MTPTMPDPAPALDGAARFAAHLAALAERKDRAALAALRRGLGKPPGAVAELHRHVVPFLPQGSGDDDAYYLVASLFGLHPKPWVGPDLPWLANLGASLHRLQRATGEAGAAGIERRFVALLNADRADLPTHLRHAVGLLRAHDLPLGWAHLLRDVRGWDHPERRVQRRWARAYWAGAPDADPAPDA